MSVQTSQLRNPDTILSPSNAERLMAQLDMLVESTVSLLRRHIFDNTAALGSMRHIPKAGQEIVDTFVQYVGGQFSPAALTVHVRALAANGLVPAVAVGLADMLYEGASALLDENDKAGKSVLNHYRQEFLRNYMESRLDKVLAEQEAFHKSLHSMLEERIEQEHLLGRKLEAEQNLALKRVTELESVANITVYTATILDPMELLRRVTQSVYEQFDLYHVHAFLFDAVTEDLTLIAAAGEAAGQMLAFEKHLVIPYEARSLVARAARTKRTVVVQDVLGDQDFMTHELLPNTHSEVVIPMIVGDVLLGVLDMHAAEVARFDDEDARILAMLGAQTAVSFQNASQYERTQEALDNLNRVQQAMAHENWQAFLSDDNREIRGYTFDNGQVQPIAREDGVETAEADTSIRRYSTPMKVRDTVIGFLDVRNPTGEPLTANEQLLLDGLSRQIADALERARLLETTELGRQELDKRAEQLAVINEVAQVVSQQLAEGELFAAVHEQIARAIVTDTFFIAIYDAEGEQFVFPYFYDDKTTHHPEPMAADPILETTRVWQSGESVCVNLTPEQFWDAETADQNLILTGDDEDGGQRPSNMAFVPLMAGAETIGVMSVQNYQFHDFTDADVSLLFGIANHVGLALENLRLFTATQEALRQTERRSEELILLNEISEMVSTHLDLSTLFESVGPRLQEAFIAKGMYFALYNQSSQMIDFPYFYSPDIGLQHIASRLADENGGFTAEVIRTKRPLLFNSTHRESVEAEFLAQGGLLEGDMRIPDTYLAVPMLAADEVIGVIAVKSYHEDRRYGEDDQRLLSTLAGAISIAVQNARQFEMTQRRAERERLINEIGQKIQGAQTVQGAMQMAVAELGRALKVKKAVVELN